MKRRRYAQYDSISVCVEIDNPADPEGEMLEREFSFFFKIGCAEPDVGIMDDYLYDFYYAEDDGKELPAAFQDAMQALPNGPLAQWHENNIYRAAQGD